MNGETEAEFSESLIAVERALGNQGLPVSIRHWHDQLSEAHEVRAEIRAKSASREYEVLWVRKTRNRKLVDALASRSGHLDPLVVAPLITFSESELLRKLGVNFVDTAGNMYVTFSGVHIDIQGRKHPSVTTDGNVSAVGPSNLFSTKSAQVVFSVLTWPALIASPIRVLSRVAGVSVGSAHQTFEKLLVSGYVSDSSIGRELSRTSNLLDLWAAAYPLQLSKTLDIDHFYSEDPEIRVAETPIWLSGESAMRDSLRPSTTTAYVDSLNPETPIRNRWRRDRPPNIFVRKKFWTTPQGYAERGQPDRPNFLTAPPILVYADLLAANEPRQREAAEQLRANDPQLRWLSNI